MNRISFIITFEHPTYQPPAKSAGTPIDQYDLVASLMDALTLLDLDHITIQWTPTLQSPMHDGKPLHES